MDVQKINMKKIMAMLAQPKVQPEPLKGISERLIPIRYIKRNGEVYERQVRLYTPDKAGRPMPLVYVAHYEMPKDSLEIRDYLLQGWAVASCANFKNEYNSALISDDLIFNNAALYTLRNMKEIDSERIAVVGGSAGGYMALMLTALQLGICCTVANGPICNVYFNVELYFKNAHKYNLKALESLTEEEKKNPIALLTKLPIAFLGAINVGAGFDKATEIIKDKKDMAAWEAVSPTGLSECFCSPTYINHATSDILVPIDQLTNKFTYPPGETLPKDYDYRLHDIEGKLGYPFCDRVDQNELNLFKIKPVTDGSEYPFEFAKTKRFNVCIMDEGAPQSYASHNLGISNGRAVDTGYIGYHFELTAAKTNVLTPEKILLFAERYAGKARQLIAHEGVDDTAYGSLTIYREEIISSLKKWIKDNGKDKFKQIFDQAVSKEKSNLEALNEIYKICVK